MLIYFFEQFINARIVSFLRDHRKLVTADPKNGAVLEDIADDPACVTQVLISGMMARGIVDFFQIVHIKNHDRK